MIRVVLADDQALVRAGFRSLLDARDDIDVVGEAADGHEAVALAKQHWPDVVLMDIRMPGLDGLDATRQIASDPRLAAVRVVILTTFGLDEYLFDALRYGASGFLVKDTRARRPGRGRPGGRGGRLAHLAQHDPAADRRIRDQCQTVPARERARCAHRPRAGGSRPGGRRAHQRRDRQRLYISPATARTHVSRIMTKLAARDRTQLVVLAYETGLVRPGWLT